MRLKQELVLGIGGWRLLRALGIQPEVCHLNEGHAAFAVLERARSYMEDHKKPFDLALTITRAGNLFTTHTAVPAGFDRFQPELVAKYLGRYAEEKLSIPFDELMALGRQDPADRSEPFNMAYLAVRGSGSVNGVSELHGHVSRRIFQPLFPRWPESEVPVGYVTNGVHMPTWDSSASDELWTEACGERCWRKAVDGVEEEIRRPQRFPALAIADQWPQIDDREGPQASGSPARGRGRLNGSVTVEQVFDPDVLTLGFARRFATYKRPNLLLHDPERLLRLLCNPKRPVQLILAGKAHPADQAGQALIKQWIDFIRRSEVRSRVVFLADYDMSLTQQLAQGVDLWINTPRRPWEACGTSGMKVLVNGGLNLSELDGWWAEAYTPDVGWAIGDRQEHGEDPAWDAAEAEALYAILEQQVVPEFYARDSQGIPVKWVARIRESMARLTPAFSASRAIFDYTERHYLPAAASFKARAADGGKFGAELLRWRHDLAASWDRVHFGSTSVETSGNQHHFSVQVFLNGLSPDAVRVELYANPTQEGESAQKEMRRQPSSASTGEYLYSLWVPASRPVADYTPRIVPYKAGAFTPLEVASIVWQR